MISLDQGGRGENGARRIPVPRDLGDAVDAIWILPARPPEEAGGWRIVADPNGHMLLQRGRDGRIRLTVVGARSRYVDVDHRERTYTVGVRLAVGALPELTGLPAYELLDVGIHVSDLFGAQGRAARQAAQDAPTPAAALAVMVSLLRARIGGRRPVDWRVRGLVTELGRSPGASVGSVARSLGVSPRTLRTVSRDRVGLSPKGLQRVHRLLRALSDMRNGTRGAEVAHAVGYVDQAHLINECSDILGESPVRFLARGRPPVSTSPAAE